MIAVLGADGQLGSAFMRLLGYGATPVTRTELDLTDPRALNPWLADHDPELVINCAAYTAVDAAEKDEETARAVNALAVGALAGAAVVHGFRFITFSTDYVFDGSKPTGYFESDATNPLSVYGLTKLEGEELALLANPESLIVRTSWLLSGTHPNFAAKMIDLIEKGHVNVVTDQRGRPTVVDDLAAATLAGFEAGATGILHLANSGETTWYELAREVAELAGLDPNRVAPCTTADYPRPAARPANSILDSERFADLGIEPLPSYQDSLASVVHDLLRRDH